MRNVAEYHPLDGLRGAGGEDRRAAIVAEARHTIDRHTCHICDKGSWCDTVVYAHHVLTLNEIFVDQLSTTPGAEAIQQAHVSGKIEGTAQALALIGKAEGEFRTQADGNAEHPAFVLAETHRKLATSIRAELADPVGRTALETKARAEEATELSAYVREVSSQFKVGGNEVVAKALDSVAGDIAKGSDGVARLRQASDVSSDPRLLAELLTDVDPDVRWWAAQNPSTPVQALLDGLDREHHPTVLAAIVANPHVPDGDVARFTDHAHPDVAGAAQRRLV